MRKETGVVLGAGCVRGFHLGTGYKKATAAVTTEPIEQLQDMILKGEPNTACLADARQPGDLQGAGPQADQTGLAGDQARHR